MASIYRPVDALDFSKAFIKFMNLDKPEVQVRLLDDVNKIMWMEAPWRWSLGTIAAVTLLTNTQDYTITLPADFLYLVDAYISDGESSPRPLEIFPVLPIGGVVGNPSACALTGTTLRVTPKPSTLPTTPLQKIFLVYKKKSPTIDETTMFVAGTLVFDDEWFWAYNEGVLWYAYKFADDQRAGSVQTDSQGRIQYTGQIAVFRAALELMKVHEKLPTFNQRAVQEPKTLGR